MNRRGLAIQLDFGQCICGARQEVVELFRHVNVVALVDIGFRKLAGGETTQGGRVPGDRYWYGSSGTGLGLPISHVKHPFYAVYEKDAFCHKPTGV